MNEKLCKDCNYHYYEHGYHKCRRPVVSKTNLITGKVETKSGNFFCDTQRSNNFENYCGPEGKFWTPRKSFWEGLSDMITKSL